VEIVNVIYTGEGKVSQDYSIKDKSLVKSDYVNSSFGDPNDKVEFFVYDLNENLIQATYDFTGYTPYQSINSETNKFNQLLIDPLNDAKSFGFDRGSFKVQYNFVKNLFNSSDTGRYWIKEISPSRTELKLSSQVITDQAIISGFDQYEAYVSLKNYYSDFYLNFGNNELIIGINAAVSTDDTGTYLLVKLYEPLPFDYDVKTQLWIIEKLSESVSYNISIEVEVDPVSTQNFLRGPNFDIAINEKNTQTTPYYTYASLLASPITSSYRQLSSYYQDKAISINVDFTNFENFVHFSNATERLNNFVYKLSLIESYNAQVVSQSAVLGNSTIKTTEITNLQASISNIVENFDVYEYYLYYASESFSWPKRTNTKPYQLYSVTSSQASNWLGSENTVPSQYTASLLYSASIYDNSNKDAIRFSIPDYVADDVSSQPYMTFMDMIGQHFDNVWIYYKDVTNRFNATNDPNTGISLDMVSDAIRSMGVQLYTNTNVTNNVYYDLFGYNYDGTLLPPTGSELIKTYVTSSLITGSIGSKQTQQEIYKRLYHNLPYLLKTKGTRRSIKALISIYGIPDNVLTVNEFGSYDRYSVDGIDAINNDRINIQTSSLEISSSVLSPYATLQYFDTDNRIGSNNIEVGFSIADVLNDNITSSLGYFNIDQLIGNPAYQYSSSYVPLVSASNAYFSSYTNAHSVWEYIRLIKYFNNSLFKTIKDFVPAKANVSTGIIVKSHILERNKYARHEPSASLQDYSQSIDMLTVSGEPGNYISGSTNWSTNLITIVGEVPYTSSQNVEKFTGEFDGTEFVATNGQPFDQSEYSSLSTLSGSYVNLGALFQNVSMSVRSQKFFDLDYSGDQLTPVNLGIITQSINNSINDNYNTYNNPNSPYAYVQDYNYYTRHFTDPRYYGSRTTSQLYNTYTAGDSSYGKTAAIDKKVPFFAYLVDIYTASFNLNGRSNAQIKYIIDGNQNILDLTKANTNIFYTQNIFKSGEGTNISLFDYDPRNQDVQYLTNKPTVQIYEGGFRYSPILFNILGSSPLLYTISTPAVSSSTITTPGGTYNADPSAPLTLGSGNWTFTTNRSYITFYGQWISSITASNATAGTTGTEDIWLTYYLQTIVGGSYPSRYFDIQIGPGASLTPFKMGSVFAGYSDPSYYYPAVVTSVYQRLNSPPTTTVVNSYVTASTDFDPYLYVMDDGLTVKLSATQSLWYVNGGFIQSGSYPGMDTPVFNVEIGKGDMLKLYNSGSGWVREEEYGIVEAFPVVDVTGSFIYLRLGRQVNPACIFSGTYPGYVKKYIINKHVPDETNVILSYSPNSNISQDGLLFPQYIDQTVKDNSGNIVKSLRAQNSLTPSIFVQ
jgi:hypothetical protein